MLRIVRAFSKGRIDEARVLLKEYSRSLDFDLSFQNFEEELSSLPGEYAPPIGRLLLAIYSGRVVGCVAFRRVSRDLCEMKRLYVLQEFRGQGVGRALATAAIKNARRMGYKKMLLDTMPSMKEAIALYLSLGFRDRALSVQSSKEYQVHGARI